MSSNQYGFECQFVWEGRNCLAQIVYAGTREDDCRSYDRVVDSWETEDPVLLAKF